MKKINAAIIGLGNIGHHVLSTLENTPDFSVGGIVRRDSSDTPEKAKKYPIVNDISKLSKIDVALICSPSREVKHHALHLLDMGISCVDSFDIHDEIMDLRQSLHAAAVAKQAVSITAAGWDPGSDSVIRVLLKSMAPIGQSFTDFGPGMSMGHSVVARSIPGVKEAFSTTNPLGYGQHRRIVFVTLEKDASVDEVYKRMKADKYFCHDELQIIEVDNIHELQDTGHGVHISRRGSSGMTPNQRFDFSMHINNPALTAQIMVSSARACTRLQAGCYTLIEVPPVDLLPGHRDEWVQKLV